GAAMQLPAWGAIIPETVPKAQLPAATRLEVVGVNLARAAGPALAGVVIARAGVAEVFYVNAASVVVLAIVLLRWRRPPAGMEGRRERFVPALRAGGRYVWHEPVVRRILLRAALFITPAMALWSLLPLIASQGLGLGADGYGALFGALGVGAIVAFLSLGKVRERLSNNAMLGGAHIAYAAALATVVVAPNVVVALASLVLAGLAWAAMISTLNAELQFFLPQWVRARGLAVHLVTFMGSQAVGALLWGLVAEGFGLRAACFLAGALMLAGAAAGVRWPVAETGHLDREPAAYWGEARLAFDPEPDAGPILVTVEFIVAPERQAAFLAAMEHLRRSRLQTGATRWELYRDGERPNRFVEHFSVPSWGEHLRQHDGRLTATDRQIEEAALAFSDPPPRAEHLVPP
ncbi:MAG: MFS transporter, partial [Chloroflexota bacterium]|nr:MFS transporter [Chloroflexota bacterium]